jgi:hypothetical protein
MATVEAGDKFASRRGSTYEVVSVDDRGFTVRRAGSGKQVRIGWKRVEQTRRRLEAGETLKYQAHAKDGGISYTVAVAVGTIWALRDIVKETEGGWQFAKPTEDAG